MIENTVTGKHCRSTFDSLAEYAEYAAKFADKFAPTFDRDAAHWFFGEDDTRYDFRDAFKMAATGWNFHLDKSLALTDKVIDEVKDDTRNDWVPTWDVQGSVVDMGMYVTGEPECMIDFPPVEITKLGRVVTICAALTVSGSMSAASMIQRGVVIAALAEILNQRGLGTEIWVESNGSGYNGLTYSHRILIKGTNDTIDHSRILYALANPSMERVIGFAAAFGLPGQWRIACDIGGNYGNVGTVKQDLDEGTLYVGTRSGSYDMESDLRKHLKTLGILDES